MLEAADKEIFINSITKLLTLIRKVLIKVWPARGLRSPQPQSARYPENIKTGKLSRRRPGVRPRLWIVLPMLFVTVLQRGPAPVSNQRHCSGHHGHHPAGPLPLRPEAGHRRVSVRDRGGCGQAAGPEQRDILRSAQSTAVIIL